MWGFGRIYTRSIGQNVLPYVFPVNLPHQLRKYFFEKALLVLFFYFAKYFSRQWPTGVSMRPIYSFMKPHFPKTEEGLKNWHLFIANIYLATERLVFYHIKVIHLNIITVRGVMGTRITSGKQEDSRVSSLIDPFQNLHKVFCRLQ